IAAPGVKSKVPKTVRPRRAVRHALCERAVRLTLSLEAPIMAMSPSPYGIPTPGATEPAAPVRARRHALGLPAGSVRALLAFSVLALLGLIVYIYPERPAKDQESIQTLYAYLWAMLFLVIASFFTAHGHSIGYTDAGSPLGLPRGTVRILLIAGFGLIAF